MSAEGDLYGEGVDEEDIRRERAKAREILTRGGTSSKGNLAACCKECNNLKKTMLPMEWDVYMERLERG